MSSKVTKGYWFEDEKNDTVTVVKVLDSICIVESTGRKKRYYLPLEFVQAIKDGGDEQ